MMEEHECQVWQDRWENLRRFRTNRNRNCGNLEVPPTDRGYTCCLEGQVQVCLVETKNNPAFSLFLPNIAISFWDIKTNLLLPKLYTHWANRHSSSRPNTLPVTCQQLFPSLPYIQENFPYWLTLLSFSHCKTWFKTIPFPLILVDFNQFALC